MRFVVTGGAGFIGSNIAHTLEARGAKVVIVDDYSAARFENLIQFRGDVVAKDIGQIDWQKLGKIDCIFHQAALTDTTIKDQTKMMTANVEGFRKILTFAAKNNTRVVYASSAAVYGNLPAPQRESGPRHPLNIYGYSKMVGDQLALCAASDGLQIVGLRYFNVFGMGEQGKHKYASMIYQLAQQIRSGKRPRIFFDGEQARDHIYVKDVVEANLLASEVTGSGIVNIGTGKSTTFNRLIAILNGVLGTHYEPDYFDNPYDFYQNETKADIKNAEKLMGFKSKHDIESSVREYLEALYNLKTEKTVVS